MNGNVKYKEPTSVEVGKFIIERGFDLSSNTRIELRSLGVMYKDTKVRSYLFGFIKMRSMRPRELVGILYFSDLKRGADPTNKWVFEAYERKNVALVVSLAKDISSQFDVKVTVYLDPDKLDAE